MWDVSKGLVSLGAEEGSSSGSSSPCRGWAAPLTIHLAGCYLAQVLSEVPSSTALQW